MGILKYILKTGARTLQYGFFVMGLTFLTSPNPAYAASFLPWCSGVTSALVVGGAFAWSCSKPVEKSNNK